MIFRQIRIGGDRNFGYLVGCESTRRGVVFDPAYTPEKVVELARDEDVTVELLVNTHGHPDHINGNDVFVGATKARVVAHAACPVAADITPADGDTLRVGSLSLRFLHTPGHSADSMCIVIDDEIVITGDILFVGKVGGTGTADAARTEFESLHEKVLALPDHLRVYPGHDFGVRPSSTIGEERRTNPFLLQPDFDAFLHLKKNWLAYKQEHGIA